MIVINNIVLTGHYKGFDNDYLLLENDWIEKHQIFKVIIDNRLKDTISNSLKNDEAIGIKGYLELDETQQLVIKATKITFLSN